MNLFYLVKLWGTKLICRNQWNFYTVISVRRENQENNPIHNCMKKLNTWEYVPHWKDCSFYDLAVISEIFNLMCFDQEQNII